MSPRPEEPVQGHTGLQILPAERNRKMTAQQLSRSATFQKIAAVDKERPGLGAGRDDSGSLENAEQGQEKEDSSQRGEGKGRKVFQRDNDPGGTVREEKEPRRKRPTPNPTARSKGDRDQVQFLGFQVLCAPCDMFGNRKPVLEGTLGPVRTPG